LNHALNLQDDSTTMNLQDDSTTMNLQDDSTTMMAMAIPRKNLMTTTFGEQANIPPLLRPLIELKD